MPFSFIDIEQQKTRIIGFLFVFLIFFYFITAYLILLVLEHTVFLYFSEHAGRLAGHAGRSGFIVPSLSHTLIALFIAFVVGLFHWSLSTSQLIEKICLGVGALPLDAGDTYHKYLKNIVDEVSVAIGGRPIEAWVIPTVGMNAFALEDFNGRAVIGVTEGLLARLARAQIEAVVGHEAGHIISGDCLATTVTCSLAEIYEEASTRLSGVLKSARGRAAAAAVFFLFLVVALMRFLSSLLRSFISREREYRADAISVRLTRDPLSLAEALRLISKNWRGEGAPGDKMQSIFIVNPSLDELDDREGAYSDAFSTHPPIKKRINILLDMAHWDAKSLEERLRDFKKVSPVVEAEIGADEPEVFKKWFVFIDQQWLGPFALDELKKISGFKPEQWVRPDGGTSVRRAFEEKELIAIFRDNGAGEGEFLCPHCKISLGEISYEGTPVHKCFYCKGTFVESGKISRILIRRDKEFSEDVKRLAEVAIGQKERFVQGVEKIRLSNAWVFDCPRCGQGHKMRRQFFVYSYPVEIDRCITCDGVWFDVLELEVLQYIYEHKDKFFGGGVF